MPLDRRSRATSNKRQRFAILTFSTSMMRPLRARHHYETDRRAEIVNQERQCQLVNEPTEARDPQPPRSRGKHRAVSPAWSPLVRCGYRRSSAKSLSTRTFYLIEPVRYFVGATSLRKAAARTASCRANATTEPTWCPAGK